MQVSWVVELPQHQPVPSVLWCACASWSLGASWCGMHGSHLSRAREHAGDVVLVWSPALLLTTGAKKKGSIYLFTALKERGRARACRFTSSRCRWPQGQEQKLLSGLPCGWQAIKHLSHLPLLSQAFIGQLDSKWSRPRQGPVTVWDTASLGCLTCYATMPIPGNWTLGIP